MSIFSCRRCKYFDPTRTEAGPEWSPSSGVTQFGRCRYPVPLALEAMKQEVQADFQDCPTWKDRW